MAVCQRVGCSNEYELTVPWRKYCDEHKTVPGDLHTSCPECGHAFVIKGTKPEKGV